MSLELEKDSGRLADYQAHYRADARAIVAPEELQALRRASEQRRLETLLRLLDLRPGEKVLDAGCGSGWLAHGCWQKGARVWAMDLAPQGVLKARGRFPQAGVFQAGDLYFLPFAPSCFDAVVLSEVVEHLEEVEAALAEARRVLRPGGRLLVSAPYCETILYHLCIHCNRLTPANAHLHSFDEEKLAGLLRSQGLEVSRAIRLSNKLLELAGFPRWSARWPYWAWRAVDAACSQVVRKPAFLCMLAFRRG